MPGEGRMDYKGHKGAFESDENIFYLDCHEALHRHVSKQIKMNTLNMWNLLYFNYTSMKLL